MMRFLKFWCKLSTYRIVKDCDYYADYIHDMFPQFPNHFLLFPLVILQFANMFLLFPFSVYPVS